MARLERADPTPYEKPTHGSTEFAFQPDLLPGDIDVVPRIHNPALSSRLLRHETSVSTWARLAGTTRRIVYTMSEARAENRNQPDGTQGTIDDLAREQGVVPLSSIDELAADIWESDEELDAFLLDLRQSRNASLA